MSIKVIEEDPRKIFRLDPIRAFDKAIPLLATLYKYPGLTGKELAYALDVQTPFKISHSKMLKAMLEQGYIRIDKKWLLYRHGAVKKTILFYLTKKGERYLEKAGFNMRVKSPSRREKALRARQ